MPSIEPRRFARTLPLFQFSRDESWAATARRIVFLAIHLIPYVLLDIFRPKTALDFRKEIGATMEAILPPDVAALVGAYAAPEERRDLLLFLSPKAVLGMLNQEFETNARISWGDWKLYQELRSYPFSGTPIAPANFNAITTIHLEECEGSEAEISAFFARFETLQGKQLFLPRRHSIADYVIAKRVDQIVQLRFIDFSCNEFDEGYSFAHIFCLLEGKTLRFETVQFSSVHTGHLKMPLASMQAVLRSCSFVTQILINPRPISEEDFDALYREFNSETRFVNRLQMSG